MRLEPPTLPAVLHILERLRVRDADEIFALRYDDKADPDRAAYAADIMAVSGFSWVASAADGEPVAVIGARPLWPGVWSLYAFGTDRWGEVLLGLTRHVRDFMIPGILNAGGHLGFCFAKADYADARRWLELLGGTAENTLKAWGKGREDFVMYAWRA